LTGKQFTIKLNRSRCIRANPARGEYVESVPYLDLPLGAARYDRVRREVELAGK